MDFSVGRWAVYAGWAGELHADAMRIDKETAQLVIGRNKRRKRKDDILATFAEEKDARHLVDKIGGIRGERDRRVAAANVAAHQTLQRMLGRE